MNHMPLHTRSLLFALVEHDPTWAFFFYNEYLLLLRKEGLRQALKSNRGQLDPIWFYSLSLVRRCEPLLAPPNGVIRGGACYSEYSSVCEMECNEGYEPLGSTKRQCTVHPQYNIMEWSGIPLQCVGQWALNGSNVLAYYVINH